MSRLMAILLLAATPALAQQPATPAPTPAPTPGQAPAAQPAARPPQGPQRPQVQSPVVDGDKATFAIYVPKAAEVKLSSGEIDRLVPGPNKAFTKGENGVWTLTVAPLLPGILRYAFEIDGLRDRRPERRSHVFGNRRGARGYPRVPGPAGTPRHDEKRAHVPAAPSPAALVRLEGARRAAACTSTRRPATRRDEAVPRALPAARRRRRRRALDIVRPGARDRSTT